MLLATGQTPWITMHHEKHAGNYELVFNETAKHNVITGGEGIYPTNASLKIDVSSNYNASGTTNLNSTFTAAVDRGQMTITLQRSSSVSSGCAPLGPGGDIDFTGSTRSSSQCIAGPVASIPAGSAVNISLWEALEKGIAVSVATN